MQSIKEIKTRMKSVSDTAKITRAMELISVAKMSRYNLMYANNQAYFVRVRQTIGDIICASNADLEHVFLEKRVTNKSAFVIIASDKGMAGEYNYAVLNYADSIIKNNPDSLIMCIGNKAYEFFSQYGENVIQVRCNSEPILEDARNISTDIEERYRAGEIDNVSIIYTTIINKALQKPTLMQVLPMRKEDFTKYLNIKDGVVYNLEFEPNSKKVFDKIVPEYLIGMFYTCLIQSKYSEHLERMRAMNSATENAIELVESLGLSYNKARQERITTELNELSTVHLIEEN